MNCRLLASFAFLCVTFSSFSQSKNANTLLWRISGNGLKQSSYLFGTMHLTDKRLFNFDDSLYHALEVTDGTAIEVNPDEMMAYAINKELENIKKGRSLKDILSEQDYKKYSASLAKKLDKPASEITEKDLVLEKNNWTSEYLAKGEMPTFVDAYLFSTAKKQGKWVCGIEDITDQAGLLETIDKTDIEFMLRKNAKELVDSSVEHMIKLYGEQDIDGMYNLTSNQDSSGHYVLLTKRNIKMSFRIDSIAHERSMLFAIGAAHLAGDDGVITLLRKRGFIVTPVMGSRKINSKDYKYVERPTPWNLVVDKQGLYSVLMPGKPLSTKVKAVVDVEFYFDFSSFTGYSSMAAVSGAKNQNRDSLYRSFAESVFKDGKNLKGTAINKDGATGMEYVSMLENMHARVQLFVKDNIVYIPMFYSLRKDSLFGVNAQKYFASFSIKDVPTTDEKLYSDTTAGIVVTFPLQLQYNSQMSSTNVKGWNVKGYGGTDIQSGVYIAKFEKHPVVGRDILNDSILFADTRRAMREGMKETKYEEFKIAGHNASYFEGSLNGYQGRFLSIVRGNTNLGIMVAGDSSVVHQPVYENIFKNIKIVPYKKNQWNPHTLTDSSLTVWAPADFIDNRTDTSLSKRTFLSYDSSTAMNIVVSLHILKKYAWYSSDTAFWSVLNQKLVDQDDSLISNVCSKQGKIGVSELLIKSRNTQVLQRIKQYQYGPVVYRIALLGDDEVINSENVNRLLNDVHFNKPLEDFNVAESRAALLLSDLSSKDSATVDEAFGEMKDVDFDSNDIAMLHECLIKKYSAPNDNHDSSAINDRAAEILTRFASPSTVAFASANYSSLTGEKKYLRPTIVYLLSMITTKQSYDALFSLLKSNPHDELFSYFSYRVTDSLKLAANYTSDVLGFLKDTLRGMQMVNILNKLNDSSLVTMESIRKYENELIALSKYDLSGDNLSKRSYDLQEILAKIKTQKSFTALRKYLTATNERFVQERAVFLLAKNNQPVSTSILNMLAADPKTIGILYKDLKEVKKLALFPKLYLTQKSLGESSLYDIISEDDYDVKTIKFIAEKTATYNNKKYKFHLFKVTFENDGGSYLGVVGGYDTNGKSLEPKEDISSMYYDEEFDAAKINELFKAWLERFEEDK